MLLSFLLGIIFAGIFGEELRSISEFYLMAIPGCLDNDSPLWFEHSRSVVKCLSHCAEDGLCVTVYYNRNLLQCVGSSIVHVACPNQAAGWNYYTQKGTAFLSLDVFNYIDGSKQLMAMKII